MDTETLNTILGEIPGKPSFLIDKQEKEEEQSLKQEHSSIQETSVSSEKKKYVCKFEDGFETDSLPKLMTHYRTEHPKPKEERRMEKEETSLALIEETETPSFLELTEQKGTQEKQTKKKMPEMTTIPNAYDRLSALLLNFGISNYKGVVDGMKFHEIDDTGALKELLLSVTTSRAKIDAIIQIWEEMYGKKKEITTSKALQPSSTGDPLSLMAKLREEEINDTIVDNYKAKAEDRRLDVEMKRKRLSGEYMDISKDNQGNEFLRMQLEQQKEENRRREMEILRQEMLRLQNNTQTPSKNTEIEILKQEFAEMRRRSEEEARIRQMEDNHRREIDSLKEFMKQTQTSSQPKTEDILIRKIEEMQKSHEKEMQDFKTELLGTKREEELKRTIESMKEDMKEQKEVTESMVGQLGSGMKDFSTNMKHAFETTILQRDHEKKEDELKKKLEDTIRERNLTNEQYALEKGEKLVGKGIEAVGGFFDGVQKTLKPSVESAGAIDRARAAANLAGQGFSPDQITTILDGKSNMPKKPGIDSASEYKKLQDSIGQPEEQATIPGKVKINVDNA